MLDVLVIYAYHRYPMRKALWNHLYCFHESSQCRAYYLNLRYRRIPDSLLERKFDLVIFDTNFAGQRWSREKFREMVLKASPLKSMKTPKVLIPQDEFLNTDLLTEFINEFSINHVFTNLPEHEIDNVYGGVDFDRTSFTRVMTGYIDPASVRRIDEMAEKDPGNRIDIGYRAAGFPWFGRHGLKKTRIGDEVIKRADGRDLTLDIDTDQRTEAQRLRGGSWLRFLLDCKYTLGAEGGTSIHDRDGSVRHKTEAYLAKHPQASFAEVEAACFPGRDGELELFAVSPRHLEACATRTCQILVKGKYQGILTPGVHYIEVEEDFSNLDAVLDVVASDEIRQGMVERARKDIVDSGKYDYDTFVRLIVDKGIAGRQPARKPGWFQAVFLYRLMRIMDLATWIKVWFIDTFFTPKH